MPVVLTAEKLATRLMMDRPRAACRTYSDRVWERVRMWRDGACGMARAERVSHEAALLSAFPPSD
jgi:hypothetical protein